MGAPSVGRALDVLDLLVHREASMSMSEIATALGIAKSSLHHILNELISREWVERDPQTHKVSLGVRAWEIGKAYQRIGTLSQRAQPRLDVVRDTLGETVRLAVLSGTDNVCVAKSPGTHTLVFDQRIGARLPAHATGLGKALLSGLDRDALDRLYEGYKFEPFTEHTLMTIDELWSDLTRTRERGWAEDNGEFMMGIRCVAVPVRTPQSGVIAAVSVSVPSARWGDTDHAAAIEALTTAAAELAMRLPNELEPL